MQIDIQTLGFTLTDALREYTHSRLGFALAHGAETIDRVTVRLSDINGPRGGADKRCHIHVAVARQADVVIEDIQADMYVAIDRATDRAGRALARQIERQRESRASVPEPATALPLPNPLPLAGEGATSSQMR